MKVSESMYGLPGKCIACRQKIRLPKLDEIQDGVSEIYLKDHPELLRTPPNKDLHEETSKALDALKSAKPLKKNTEDDEPTPNTELDIADVSKVNREDYSGTTPLDPLESLQRLTSLQWKLERKLDKIRSVKPVDQNLKAETKGQLTKLNQVRNDFDEQLRQRLMEAAIELTSAQEKITHLQVSVRVNEISYDEFHEQVTRLRARRDRMERRQQNLRGWIASVDPFVIGGYISMDLDSIPDDGYRLFVPSEPEETEGLLQAYTRGLKQAMKDRSLAEHKLDEAKNIRDESGDTLSLQAVAEARGERNRARGNVGFYQARLNQLKRDLKSDLETAESQLDNVRSRLSMGDITRSTFDDIESGIKRVKLDNAKGLSVIERALAANASGDIPQVRGTFLERLSIRNAGIAQWSIPMAWAAALLYGVSVFLPLVGTQSLLRSFLDYYAFGSTGIWWIGVPLVTGIGVGLASIIGSPTIRGQVLLGIGVLTYLLMVYGVHESNYSLDPMASKFRTGGDWYFRPGILVLLLATVGVLASGCMELWSKRNGKIGIGGALLVLILLESYIVTDAFYTRLPEAEISTPTVGPQDSRTGYNVAVIEISNIGKRSFHLVNRESSARNAYRISLEKRVGSSSFADAVPRQFNRQDSVMSGSLASVTIEPSEGYIEPFPLAPGEYKIVLTSMDGQEMTEKFTMDEIITESPVLQPPLTDIPPDVIVPAQGEPTAIQGEMDEETETTSEIVPDEPQVVLPLVLLKGILESADGSPRFSIVLTEDGTEEKLTLGLGEPLISDWIVTEYNPGQSTITLQRDGGLMIIRRGEVYSIEN
jgi:hypothetical protein